MLHSRKVSVCSAWAQINPKTPCWSQVTQQAGFRSGTFLPMQWTSSTRWAGEWKWNHKMYSTVDVLVCLVTCFLSVQPTCERPPLLQCWGAHKRALVCVEVIEVADRLLVLTASVDGSAGLWTKDGDHVGLFGQEVIWNISDPATYHRWDQSVCLSLSTSLQYLFTSALI